MQSVVNWFKSLISDETYKKILEVDCASIVMAYVGHHEDMWKIVKLLGADESRVLTQVLQAEIRPEQMKTARRLLCDRKLHWMIYKSLEQHWFHFTNFLLESNAIKRVDISQWAYLCWQGDEEAVKYLIARGNIGQEALDKGLKIVSQRGFINIATCLLLAGANPSAFNGAPLERAIYVDDIKMVQLLLEHKADIDISDGAAFQVAFMKRRLPILDLLVKGGANIHICDDYYIEYAERLIPEALPILHQPREQKDSSG